MEKLAVAGLVGLARMGLLCAATTEALHHLNDVAEMTDYRENIPEEFLDAIEAGHIRTDAFWKSGPEGFLCRLVSLYREEEA